METGNRSEMVRTEGFRLTNFRRFPDCQSRYLVESALAQNFRSSSSLLNFGSVFFVFRIDCSFISVHVPVSYHPNQAPSNSESHKQPPFIARLSKGIVSLLFL